MSEIYTRDPYDPATWPFQEPKHAEEAHARIREQDGLFVQFNEMQSGGDPDFRRVRNFAAHELSRLHTWLSRGQ